MNLRMSGPDKKLAVRLAKAERRTLSSFLVNLIHERAAQHRTMPSMPLVLVKPVNINETTERLQVARQGEE